MPTRGRFQLDPQPTCCYLRGIAVCLFVLIGVGTSGAALAASAAGNPAATTVPPQPKMVCRREKVTGSQIKQRVCRTAEQMAQDRANANAQLKAMQDYQSRTWERQEVEMNR